MAAPVSLTQALIADLEVVSAGVRPELEGADAMAALARIIGYVAPAMVLGEVTNSLASALDEFGMDVEFRGPAYTALDLAAQIAGQLDADRSLGNWSRAASLEAALSAQLQAATVLSGLDVDPGSVGAYAASLGISWYEDDERFTVAGVR